MCVCVCVLIKATRMKKRNTLNIRRTTAGTTTLPTLTGELPVCTRSRNATKIHGVSEKKPTKVGELWFRRWMYLFLFIIFGRLGQNECETYDTSIRYFYAILNNSRLPYTYTFSCLYASVVFYFTVLWELKLINKMMSIIAIMMCFSVAGYDPNRYWTFSSALWSRRHCI